MSHEKAPAATGAMGANVRPDSATKSARVKHPPADNPSPETARLTLRKPTEFCSFSPQQPVRIYLDGCWSSAVITSIDEQLRVVVKAKGRTIAIWDARNVLSGDEFKAYSNHKARFQSLCRRRREKRENERQEQLAELVPKRIRRRQKPDLK